MLCCLVFFRFEHPIDKRNYRFGHSLAAGVSNLDMTGGPRFGMVRFEAAQNGSIPLGSVLLAHSGSKTLEIARLDQFRSSASVLPHTRSSGSLPARNAR